MFSLRVIPRASRSEVIGELNGSLKVKISAPPVDGAANDEVVKLIAKAFGVSRSSVSIIAGQNSKTKRISVRGSTPERLRRLVDG